MDREDMRTCQVWAAGQWESRVVLLQARFGHVSWNSEAGLVLLGGEGGESKKTSEIIKDGVSEPAFPLRYIVVNSCAIRDGVKTIFIFEKGLHFLKSFIF